MKKTGLFIGAATAALLSASAAQAGQIYYSVMNNANEPVTAALRPSPATGQGWLILNDAQTSATVYVLHNEATTNAANPITIGHIHRGPAGVAGPVIFPFPTPPTSPVGPLVWAIPAAELPFLFAGGLYSQIHNSANPSGDIRGQLVRVMFSASATNSTQLGVARVLDNAASLDSDLDQVLMATAAASATVKAATFDDMSGSTLFAQSAAALDTMGGFEDSMFEQAAHGKASDGKFAGFVKGGMAFGKRDTSVDQTGSKVERPYLLLGMDFGLGDAASAGLAIGFADASEKYRVVAGSTAVKTTTAQAYVSSATESVVVSAAFGYGFLKVDTRRGLASLGRTATGAHDGNAWSLGAKISMPFELDSDSTLSPYALLSTQHVSMDAYTEAGAGSAGLIVPKVKSKDTAAELGAALHAPMGGTLAAHLEVGWRQSLEKGGEKIAAKFVGAPTTFDTNIIGRSPSSAHLGAELSTAVGDSLTVSAGYHGYISSRASVHSLEARVTLRM